MMGEIIMDPNAKLEKIRATYEPLRVMLEDTAGEDTEMVQELLDSIEALDEWLSKGGFLPKDWQR